MEHRPIIPAPRPHAIEPPEPTSLELDALAAHWRLILAVSLIFAGLATGYVLLRTPLYESRVQLVVETSALTLFREEPVVVPAPVLPNLLETQVRLIASRGTALATIDALHLADDPEFAPAPSLRTRLGALFRTAPADASGRRDRAATAFLDHLRTTSLGLSNVVEVGFTSRDPAKAAMIANEIARIYRQQLDQTAADRAAGASAWVQQRLGTIGTHARVISEAAPSATGTGMRGTLIIAVALMAGAMTGAATAILLALLRPAARTPDQISAFLGVPFLGALPSVERAAGRIVLDAPAAPFTRTLRHVAASLQEIRRDRPILLGMASIERGEGTSTVATNLAHLLALQGHQVMLVDGNADNPTTTRTCGLTDAPGLGELLLGAAHEEITVISDGSSGLDILPIGSAASAAPRGSVFQLPATGELAARLHASYEFVVIDLPPILDSAELRAAAFLDAILLVVDARPKPHRLLREAMARTGRSRTRIVGFVVNRPASRPGALAALVERLMR